MKYWERREFKRLRKEWCRRLREDGFYDLEMEAEERIESDVSPPCAGPGVIDDIGSAAAEALRKPGVWRGLPKDARRMWALMVHCGWTARRSAEFLGHRDHGWPTRIRAEILKRIG